MLLRLKPNSLQHKIPTQSCFTSSVSFDWLPVSVNTKVANGKQLQMLVRLQVSALEQLEQLEFLASTGFGEPDLNSDNPDQVPNSFPAAHADKHAYGSSQPTSESPLHPDSRQQQLAHGVQQESSGGEQGEREGAGGCAEDIHAVGHLMVQLFRGRMLHHGATDYRQAGTCAQARGKGTAVALAMQ